MSRALNDLCPKMLPKAMELLARATEAQVPVLIVDTLRTPAEQKVNVAKGVSWTLNSLHLPQTKCCGKSHAIDVVPWKEFREQGPDTLQWDEKSPAWQVLGRIGQAIGLKWGVVKNGKRIDLGHFEYRGE